MERTIKQSLNSELFFQDRYGILRLAASQSINHGIALDVQSEQWIPRASYLSNITRVILSFFSFQRMNIIFTDYVDAFNVMWIETDDLMQTLWEDQYYQDQRVV